MAQLGIVPTILRQGKVSSLENFGGFLNAMYNYARQVEDGLQEERQLDKELLHNLELSQISLQKAKTLLIGDPALIPEVREKIPKERDVWSALYLAAGGRESDMELVELQTKALRRVDSFLPNLELRLNKNGRILKEGIQAPRRMRDEIRGYQ